MKAKIFSIAVLLFLVSAFTTGNAQSCSSSGEGASTGSVSCTMNGGGSGEYDAYILGGLTVSYQFSGFSSSSDVAAIIVQGSGISASYSTSPSSSSFYANSYTTTTYDGYWSMSFRADNDDTYVSANLSW